MNIRFKTYKGRGRGARTTSAIRITEKNLAEVVAYICKNGGAATGHLGDTASGKPARIRIKQHTFGKNWSKNDWRVAYVGDFITRDGERSSGYEFARVKEDEFEASFSA